MKFKNWLMTEAGHLTMNGPPQDIMVMLHGQPSILRGVSMIDPRFEFHDIPHPHPNANKPKFLGDVEYSLPLVNQRGQVNGYISSTRGDMMSGVGFVSPTPRGVKAPLDWADHAIVVDQHGKDLIAARDFIRYAGQLDPSQGFMGTDPAVHPLPPVTVGTQNL